MSTFDTKGFAVITTKRGSRDFFFIISEDNFPKLNPEFYRIEKQIEKSILTDFFSTCNRANDNKGTSCEIWKTDNFRFVLNRDQADWIYRRVELIN